ncbi:MAG TPA: hypothetical protein VHG28_00895 [Longimicrobiaceae bacterium]|nr:hypothetical protein [Longimicrobiaceae bacterium]
MTPEPATAEPTLTLTRWEIRPRDGGPPIRGDVRVRTGAQPRSVVVICHGFKGFRTWGFFPVLARAVALRGHAAVTFDFSRNGVGADGVDFSALELFAENTHTRNLDEIRMVLDALRGGVLLPRSPRWIGLLGHSRGGGEAILAAAEDPRVDALVTWAAIADIPARWTGEQVERWRRGETVEIVNARTGQPMPIGPGYWRDTEMNRERLDILRAAASLEIPWLIIHGEDDTSVSPDDARALFDAAGDRVELLLVEDADHTFGARHPWAGTTPELRSVVEATLDWFDEQLR